MRKPRQGGREAGERGVGGAALGGALGHGRNKVIILKSLFPKRLLACRVLIILEPPPLPTPSPAQSLHWTSSVDFLQSYGLILSSPPQHSSGKGVEELSLICLLLNGSPAVSGGVLSLTLLHNRKRVQEFSPFSISFLFCSTQAFDEASTCSPVRNTGEPV